MKATTGYDLTQLIIGSEGTLALVTEATLRLYPRAPHTATVLAPFPSLDAVTHAIPRIVASGVGPMILEYIDLITLSAITAHVGLELGIPEEISSTALAYLVVMMEQMSDTRLDEDVAALAEQLAELGALDVYVLPGGAAASLIDAREKSFWVAKANNADDIVDIVVPRASLPDFMERVATIAADTGSWIAGCGHAGDGNVHLSVFQADPEVRAQRAARPVRHRDGARRRDLRRARHRPGQAALLPRARGPGQARAHAPHQGRVRPARHPQPRRAPRRGAATPTGTVTA